MPKISIIIPTYNSSLFIKRTINSVLGQTFKDWELLIVDDCSTDNTIEIVNDFIKTDSRIKLFKTPTNSGAPALPKNIGIENSHGEYVAFLDHDDEWLLTKLEKQLAVFENLKNKNIGLVTCFANIKNNSTNNIIFQYHNSYRGNIIKKIVKGCFVFSSSSVMVKSKILKNIGGFDEKLKSSDDWDMWIRISEKEYDFDFVPEYLLSYFVHANNVYYGNNDPKSKSEFFIISQKHFDLFLKYSPFGLGYGYFAVKNYNLARKYLVNSLFFVNSSGQERLKSVGFIILTFFPGLEKTFKKIWKIL